MITGLAHSAICVPDVEEATRWYEQVLGLTVLSPPYRMSGPQMDDDMGELVPRPVVVKAAILGTGRDDRVLEVIEYPEAPGRPRRDDATVTDYGLSHVGLVCEDIDATRADLESKGVAFLTAGIASVAGVRTTWFTDPFGVVFILIEKRHPDRPYWQQHTS